MTERWMPISGYEGLYSISNMGKVKSFNKVIWRKSKNGGAWKEYNGGVLSQRMSTSGYIKVELCDLYGNKRGLFIHRLIADAFIGDIPDGYVVNHKDGDKTNNIVSNLEIVSKRDDILHAYATGLRKPVRWDKTNYANAKLTEKDIIDIRKNKGKIIGRELAKIYNVTQANISRILTNQTWKDVRSF